MPELLNISLLTFLVSPPCPDWGFYFYLNNVLLISMEQIFQGFIGKKLLLYSKHFFTCKISIASQFYR
nr:MAG TPA: hypothetical protein [Caudoviricetes sp.]